MMFQQDTVKEDDQNESSGNLSQEVDKVLQEPIAHVEPSKAEPDDMENFNEKTGNFNESK